MARPLITVLTLLAGPGLFPVSWASAEESVDFNRQIRSLLSERCLVCHGPDESSREAGLRLDTFEGATEDLGGYAPITPGDPDASEVVLRIESDDPDMRMPPPGKGPPLGGDEIELIRRWIAQGANYERHWAYIPPRQVELPEVDDPQWPRNAIDFFILHRLEKSGLHPSPEADRLMLARRVALALTGLPPTVEQAQEFVRDEDPQAYEHYVDSLLASPAFGERWARVWLDLARYADSAGYADDPQRTIWAYRDYVIRALNENKPFDQFTVEQIAGDLLENPTDAQLTATAFHRNTMTNNEGGTNDEQFRNEAIVDRVNTTMAVWMGTTMACAQCHTHKYDPITQTEYFQFFDFFNQSQDADRRDESPTITLFSDRQKARRRELRGEIDSIEAQLARQTPQLDAALDQWLATLNEPPSWEPLQPTTARVLPPISPSSDSPDQPRGDQSGDDQPAAEGSTDLKAPATDDQKLKVADNMLVLSGDRPEQAIYEIEIPVTESRTLSTLRLSALRLKVSEQQATNFVLSRAALQWQPSDRQPVSGRYVRVTLPGKQRILHLAEIQVFAGTENLALSKSASQSSTDYGAPAERGNDGNTDGNFSAGSVTHNAQEDDPWWEVDLEAIESIDRLVLWNRTDGGDPIGRRLDGYRVEVLDSDRQVVWSTVAGQATDDPMPHDLSGDRALVFQVAHADYAQPNFPAQAAIKGLDSGQPTNAETGWAIGGAVGQTHELVLGFETPVKLEEGTLVLRLEQVSVHSKHLLTHFGLSSTADPEVARWAALPNDIRALVRSDQRSDDQRKRLAEHFRSVTPLLADLRGRRDALQTELEQIQPMTTVPVMREVPQDNRRISRVQLRGNYQSLADTVTAGVPDALHDLPEDAPRDRLGLARWLVSPENPLTARVIVNRHWEQLFGSGLVETSEEFGSQGDLPSHPQLLDWLAVDLVQHGWDLKQLLKQLVMSATYRQSSRVTPELLETDADNRLLSRGPRFRIPAEMVRDQSLQVAGLLSDTMYGPPVRPPQPELGLTAAFGSATDWKTSQGADRYRRGIYTTWRRSNPYPSMATFDAPNREVCTIRRSRTNTPLQALVTLNDPVYVEAAQSLARKVASISDVDQQLRAAFQRALIREPDDQEQQRLRQLYDAVLDRYRDDPEAASAMAEDPLGPLPDSADPAQMAALTVVANAILNLDEMLMPR